MKYHHPSFMSYFTRLFDVSFNIYAYNWRLSVIASNPYFSSRLLCQYVIEALIKSVEEPLDAPDGPRQRSLFEAPPVGHCDALSDALTDSWEYLCSCGEIHTEGGERREFKINLRVVQGIVQDVRRSEDTKLAIQMINQEFSMSDRLLLQKIYHLTGRRLAEKRIRNAMHGLIELEYCENNGRLRTVGREVLKWPN